MTMRGGTLFSGIGAPECAAPFVDWRWSAEIEPFASAVHAARFPGIPNLGDVTKVDWNAVEPVDLLVFGSPCQAFSVAGKRQGLDDPRGDLTLVALGIARRLAPRWLVWENVPGVLSIDEGRTFGTVLGILGQLGYGFAYRVLDAQFFGVPQRRRRVFVVGCLGDWRAAAAVLFERESLRRDLAPRRKAGERVAGTVTSRFGNGSRQAGANGNLIARCVTTGEGRRQDGETCTLIAHSLRADGFDASEDGTGRGTPLVPVAMNLRGRAGGAMPELDDFASLRAASGGSSRSYLAFSSKDHGADAGDIAPTLRAMPHDKSHANAGGQVAVIYDAGRSPDADASEARSAEALRALRVAVGEETFLQWCVGIAAAFWPAEVLRSGLYGESFRCPTEPEHGLVNVSLSCAQARRPWTVQDLWRAGCFGCPPQGRQPSEQLARELGQALSQLPYAPSPGERFLSCLREADEGSGLLRQALSALQEIRRSYVGEGQPARAGSAVRRLTVSECEALQGFPRGFTAIAYRNKPAADGPRYRALGNSMAMPVMRWIIERIAFVDAVTSQARAA